MFKRLIAIPFLLLSSIVLLGIMMVPHHHHGEAMCFVASHCTHDADCEDHAACCHHDEHSSSQSSDRHEHSSDANCCNVEVWLLSNAEPGQKCEHSCVCATCDSKNIFPVAILPEIFEPDIPPIYYSFRQTPLNETYTRIYVSRALGLRAPPFC